MVDGNEAAYRLFYDVYFNRLFRYLLVLTSGEEETAREALQATLVRVVRHIKMFPDESVLWNWLAVLARSALSDQSRKRRRYLAFLDRFTEHSQAQLVVPDEDGEADARLLASLERGLSGLALDERDLVERKYFARQPVREMSVELQTSEKAIESRLVRARHKLKQLVLNELRNGTTR